MTMCVPGRGLPFVSSCLSSRGVGAVGWWWVVQVNLGSTLGGGSSRARILAQQRELMMKRRQEGMKAGACPGLISPHWSCRSNCKQV